MTLDCKNHCLTGSGGKDTETAGIYIAGVIPKDAGPNHVYFTIAGGDEDYQLQIGKLELIPDED